MASLQRGFDGSLALVPGELRGYRRFRLTNAGLLPTVHFAQGPWSAGVHEAVCAAPPDPDTADAANSVEASVPRHEAPDRDCACGLYGWYHPSYATSLSGFGNVTAVVAARGRIILGDYGFRAARARIEAVALPGRLRLIPAWGRRQERLLRERYPHTAVYQSRRRMLRDHPPHDVSGLGICARPNAAARYAKLMFALWLPGVAAFYAVTLLPHHAAALARPAAWFAAIIGFLAWQTMLIWLVTRSSPAPPGRPPGHHERPPDDGEPRGTAET